MLKRATWRALGALWAFALLVIVTIGLALVVRDVWGYDDPAGALLVTALCMMAWTVASVLCGVIIGCIGAAAKRGSDKWWRRNE